MGLTVRKQPVQFKFIDSDLAGTISNDSGDVLITTSFSHSLAEDQAVLIRSNFDGYNGIRFVSVASATTFNLKISPGGSLVPFINGAGDTMAYRYSMLEHVWQCAHLPVVYEIESDRYPNNQVEDDYTPRTISSIANAQGYMRLNLAVQLPGPQALSFIQIEDGTTRSIYQILTVINNYSIVINLAYDAGFSIGGLLVSTWYNNYCIKANVWCGLPAGHPWESMKPYELAGTLKFVPDDDNRVKFSISELVKSYITTRNNLTLDSLPNNVDFYAFFYIEYFESFDSSNGTEISTTSTSPIQDTFEGIAINAKLPFKDLNVSALNDYLDSVGFPALFLILQSVPVAFVGRFFDISFLNRHDDISIVVAKKLAGVTLETVITSLGDVGQGVIRAPILIESGYDQYCIKAQTDSQMIEALPALSTFTTEGGSLAAKADWLGWTLDSSNWVYSVNGSGGISNELEGAFIGFEGVLYDFTFGTDCAVTGVNPLLSTWTYSLLDSMDNVLDYVSLSKNAYGVSNHSFSLTPIGGVPVKMRLVVINNSVIEGKTMVVTSMELTNAQIPWTTGANPSISLPSSPHYSAVLKAPYASVGGQQYDIAIDFDSDQTMGIVIALRNGTTQTGSASNYYFAGNNSVILSITPASDGDNIVVYVANVSLPTVNIDINSMIMNNAGGTEPIVITEFLCIDVVEECADDTFVETNGGLIEQEGGGFIALE